MLQLILAMTIWGTLGLAVLKSGLGSIDIAFYRCLVGVIILIPYCWWRGLFKTNHSLNIKTISLISVGGVFVILNWILLFESFKLASITLGNISYYLQPIFLVVLGRFFFKEKVSLTKWIFILLSMAGVMMTMNITLNDFHLGNKQVLGVGCALAAGLLYSFATIVAKDVKHISPTLTTLIQLIVGSCMLVPFAHVSMQSIHSPTLFYILLFGLVYTVIAFICYYESVKHLPTTTIAVVSYIDPIVAILTDVLFFSAALGSIQLIGIALTLISSYFVINANPFKFAKRKTLLTQEEGAN